MDRSLRILIQASLIDFPAPAPEGTPCVGRDVLATLASNLTAFGFGLSRAGFERLRLSDAGSARVWWEWVEPVLMDLTGADRKMEEHVVYKNFPAEVLAMSEADYWMRQILMYWGLPNEWFTEEPLARAPHDEPLSLRILHPAQHDSLKKIFRSLLDQPTRWTPDQKTDAAFLLERLRVSPDLSTIAFKENMATLAVQCLKLGLPAKVDTATDVLRIVAGMCGGDVSLRTSSKVPKLPRAERRFFLSLLEGSTHLEADFARRPERFKRLVHQLHPGDFGARYPRVVAAAGKLYNATLPATSNAIFEALLARRELRVLEELKERPGEMMRRLHHLVLLYGDTAASAFIEVLPQLSLLQLLKIERYLAKVNERKYRTFPPLGNWGKLQIVPADPERRLPSGVLRMLLSALASEIQRRVAKRVPAVKLSPDAKLVKLPTSDSELLPFGRGTVFPLPPHVKFIRSAVYWQSGPTHGNIWYDNSWNFFNEKWKARGACCWNETSFGSSISRPPAAIFSGDPTNSKDLEGRACQLIDLYLDHLAYIGVRYAVWNILCYSRKTFDEAKEVFAALQWGADPEKGKLFDPARCQLSFPVKGPQMTKYIALIDVTQRVLIYLDANLRAHVSSAASNGKTLEQTMPAFVEYLDSLPSVHDTFAHLPHSDTGLPVLYSDAQTPVRHPEAYVFKPSNEASTFRAFPLNQLLVTA